MKILRFFIKKCLKILVVSEKAVPLQRISRNALRSQAASRQRVSSLHSICTDFVTRIFGVWCNGNTADSGPAFPGSSPGTPTD